MIDLQVALATVADCTRPANRARIRDGTPAGRPVTVLHAIADRVMDEYLAATDACEGDIDMMKSLVFAPRDRSARSRRT
ncbi:hypothetical protein BBK82_07155 [Lentzea guizhouensis]|uniref:Uncharacterized protein n=1 Tax=Lentzea guizhouensis TaxID=1586287 RepID=A0A1B2HDT6_9PSEU|nr:hypothetical protein BBK82_07155 [Lentzea guizhouensis]